MKHLSEKQRRRQVNLNKKRFVKENKRNAKRKVLNLQEFKVKVAARRIGKLQRKMVKEQMRALRESSNS